MPAQEDTDAQRKGDQAAGDDKDENVKRFGSDMRQEVPDNTGKSNGADSDFYETEEKDALFGFHGKVLCWETTSVKH